MIRRLISCLDLIDSGSVTVSVRQETELGALTIDRDNVILNIEEPTLIRKGIKAFRADMKGSSKLTATPYPKVMPRRGRLKDKLERLEAIGSAFAEQDKFLVIRYKDKDIVRIGNVRSLLSLLGIRYVSIKPRALLLAKDIIF